LWPKISPFQGRSLSAQFIRKDFEMGSGAARLQCRSLRHPQIHDGVSERHLGMSWSAWETKRPLHLTDFEALSSSKRRFRSSYIYIAMRYICAAPHLAW